MDALVVSRSLAHFTINHQAMCCRINPVGESIPVFESAWQHVKRSAVVRCLWIILVVVFFSQAPVLADVVYVSNAESNTIEEFNASGAGTVFASSGLTTPQGLAFDNMGNLYVANYGNNTIEKFNSSGVGTVFASSGLDGPSSLVFDKNGNLYVLNVINNTIEKFDSNGNGSLFASLVVGHEVNAPQGLAFDENGNLYVANNMLQSPGHIQIQIEEFNPSGVSSNFADINFVTYGATGLSFDTNGNLYISLNSTIAGPFPAMIEKIDSSGNESLFANSNLDFPRGLAFGSSGTLFVADWGDNTIEEFSTNGVGAVFANTGLNQPYGIAVQVPEPSTLALIALGAITWSVSRRVRRRS
jgi:sugar lactone lactonase YvrE